MSASKNRDTAKPEVNQKLGAFLTALALRLMQFFRPPEVLPTDEPSPLAKPTNLEAILQDVFSIPEIQQTAGSVLKQIEAKSEPEWRQGITRYLSQIMIILTARVSPPHEQERIAGLSDEERAALFLNTQGINPDLTAFSLKTRYLITSLLQRIVNENPSLQTELADLLRGLFSTEADRSRVMLLFALQALGEPWAVVEVLGAIEDVREKLISSHELAGTVKFIEVEQSWGISSRDEGFSLVWRGVGPKIMARSKEKQLEIPGIRTRQRKGRDEWDEEKAFAQMAVYTEISRRIARNPLGILGDAVKGSLRNSLAKAVENDLRDEIRRLRAKKRDTRKSVSLDKIEGGDEGTGDLGSVNSRGVATSTIKDSAAQVLDEMAHSELIQVLTKDEKNVIDLNIIQGFKIAEVATSLRKSHAWVYKIKARAIEKMRNALETTKRQKE